MNCQQIPCAKYFRSLRVDDEVNDGGGVYGRNITLPHYHAHKLVGTIGDSLVHIILKNSLVEERQGLLDVLMLLDSFTKESLLLENTSNVSVPPYLPFYSTCVYGYVKILYVCQIVHFSCFTILLLCSARQWRK